MYNPSIWDRELGDGRRDYVAKIVLNSRDKAIHMNLLAKSLDYATGENNAIPDAKTSFHNSRYRRILTSDIDEINRDMRYPLIITSINDGVKYATRDEAQHLYDMLRGKALKILAKAAIVAKKAGLDSQIDITGDEIRIFMEEAHE